MKIIRKAVKYMKTLTYINNLRNSFIRITKEQEKAIIEYWGNNIPSYELTEQDIWEQTRKVIMNA